VAACSGRAQTPLTQAAASLLEVRRQTDTVNQYAAAGWFVRTQYGDELVWKGGDTGGYSAFIAYSTRAPARGGLAGEHERSCHDAGDRQAPGESGISVAT
jgi:hypothetical protein